MTAIPPRPQEAENPRPNLLKRDSGDVRCLQEETKPFTGTNAIVVISCVIRLVGNCLIRL